MRFLQPAWFCGLLLGTLANSPAQEAVVRGICRDAASGQPVACTVTIVDAKGKVALEQESFKSGFRCLGQFSKRVAAGRITIRVARGFETEVIQKQIELPAGAETNLVFDLRRKVDMRARGWFSGDSHAHMLHGERTVPVDFDFVAHSARAEDLQYLSLAQAWSLDQVSPEKLEAELNSRSVPDCLLTWNLEAPKNYYKGDAGRCLGHCWTLGMKGRMADRRDVIGALLDASAWDYESGKPSFANFESHWLIHKQGGAVFYTHPARWWMGSWGGQGGYPKVDQMRVSNMAVELPLDTLAGPTYDGIDLLTGSGEREANAKAFDIWALLLNHGYRLAATASSDCCFDRPGGATPGTARTYTFLEGDFSLTKATQSTAVGRTVATTGPLLIPLIDGKPPGSIFAPGRKEHTLSIEAWPAVNSTERLESVDVLRNGRVWRTFQPDSNATSFRTNLPIRETERAWYSVRVTNGRKQPLFAIGSAFYFAERHGRGPTPIRARVHAKVLDADTGRLVPARLVEVEYSGAILRDGSRHQVKTGEGWLSVPATVRLRAETPGYIPTTLSPFFDYPALVELVTGLGDNDLLRCETYEKVAAQLGKIDLVFRLQKEK